MEDAGGASVYGASLAGGGFDLNKFVRQPQTIVRLLSWVFAMVVFGCITTEGYINTPQSPEAKCIFNQNNSACHYAVTIGVIAFLACVAFLVLDVYLPFMSNSQERKYAVMADLGFSGAWAFLWFVCFCLLANQWGRTQDVRAIPQDAAHATIAFSFFSIATWGILAYYGLVRLRRGTTEVTLQTHAEPPSDHHTPYPPTYPPTTYNPTTYTPTTYNPTTYTPTSYAAYPSSMPDMPQPPPFSSKPQPQGDVGYLPPKY